MKLKSASLVVLLATYFLISGLAVADDSLILTNFTADYYLTKEKDGVAGLVAQETLDATFKPNPNGNTGIVRVLPTKYQGHNVSLKVISVTNQGGQTVFYRTAYDKDHNLILTIGDPAIRIFGSQTYTIKYDAKGVVNFFSDRDEFLPNINGRGWDVPINSVSALIHVPAAIANNLTQQKCTIDVGRCTSEIKKTASETTFIVQSAGALPAGKSMQAKLDFKPGTFKQVNTSKLPVILEVGGAILGLLAIAAGVRTGISFIWRGQKKPAAGS